IHDFRTRAASLRPATFFRFVLFTFTSSARSKISRISLSLSKPMARSSVVTGNFFLRSIYAYITLLMSVANSIQDPLKGIIRAEYNFVPFAWRDCPKKTPGDICNCDTITHSAPLITYDPFGVMYGIVPKYTSCTIVSKSSCSGSVQYNFNLAFNGTLYVNPLSIHSAIV